MGVALVFLFAHFHVYTVMVTFELTFKQLIRNSVILAISEIKTNFIILFFLLIVAVPIILFFPYSIFQS